MQKTQDLVVMKDGDLSARVLDQGRKDEMAQARAFRHKIFLEELGWSVLDSKGQEFDQYDECSVHFGAFSESGKFVGYCRLILPKKGFMIEKEFASLVYPGYHIRKENDTVEISRFAIPKEQRSKLEGFRIVAVLLRSVYQWAKVNKMRYIYGVCATDHLQFVLGVFSSCCTPIGPAHEYQPGMSSSAFILDFEKLDVEKVKEFWAGVMGKPR